LDSVKVLPAFQRLPAIVLAFGFRTCEFASFNGSSVSDHLQITSVILILVCYCS